LGGEGAKKGGDSDQSLVLKSIDLYWIGRIFRKRENAGQPLLYATPSSAKLRNMAPS
jgi:hypothetical protein